MNENKNETETLLGKIQLVLHWLNDLDSGEMIEAPGYYCKNYMAFNRVSEKDLSLICKSVNALLSALNHRRRITWNMGEIIPGFVKEA
jgi:hypothetical protein